ncbi:hypothetical protein ACQ4M4_18905 [Leptolyngbya sp. AN02str]|uniref:hypothetical protein n=1 Tax=Leptolyngbya sp. AN02str TaxID=3423363 RepID=UPI003D31DC52
MNKPEHPSSFESSNTASDHAASDHPPNPGRIKVNVWVAPKSRWRTPPKSAPFKKAATHSIAQPPVNTQPIQPSAEPISTTERSPTTPQPVASTPLPTTAKFHTSQPSAAAASDNRRTHTTSTATTSSPESPVQNSPKRPFSRKRPPTRRTEHPPSQAKNQPLPRPSQTSSPPRKRRLPSVRSLSPLLVLLLWLGVGSAVISSGWYAFWLVINPGSVPWLSWLFPEWSREAALYQDLAPKPLVQLQAEAQRQGFALGDPLPLGSQDQPNRTVLVPVLSNGSNCVYATGCGRVEELRVYHAEEGRRGEVYRLGDRLGVKGPDESFIISPWTHASSVAQGSSRQLPLHKAQLLEGQKLDAGAWFLLSGTERRGNNQLLYGHIGRYDPHRQKLELLMPWASTTGKLPRWQAVTDEPMPELVIEQTVGIEPRFLVYQAKLPKTVADPIELMPISMQETVLKHNSYESALVLARAGLWTPALEVIQQAKLRLGDRWSPRAQSQLDVIAMHAAFTKAQADQDWASATQRITALIYDGRWEAAWAMLRTAIAQGSDILNLLKSDENRIWQRVQAAERVSPGRLDVQRWGGMIVYARQGRAAAIAWLNREGAKATTGQSSAVQTLMQELDNTPVALEHLPTYVSRLYGVARPLTRINPKEWRTPTGAALPTANSNQAWYRIELDGFYNGQRWVQSPFEAVTANGATARYVWTLLGLQTNTDLQLAFWNAQEQLQYLRAPVHAVQWHNGTISLLALGDLQPPEHQNKPLLAIAPNTLNLVAGSSMTLQALSDQAPEQASLIIFSLVQEFRQQGEVDLTRSQPHELLAMLGNWTVQYLDVTGDVTPEAVISGTMPTLQSSELTFAATSTEAEPAALLSSKTFILQTNGDLLYSELEDKTQRFLAIATLTEAAAPTLLVERASEYHILQWRDRSKSFE